VQILLWFLAELIVEAKRPQYGHLTNGAP